MTTTLSSKGQVVLPRAARNRLRLRPGDKFDCRVDGKSIILTPHNAPKSKPRLIRDGATGLIVTQGPPGSPQVTSDQIQALLADFP